MKLTLHCPFGDESVAVEVPTTEGWSVATYGYDEERDPLCPTHAAIRSFQQNQCPGCVASWGDCPMWEAFAYSHRRTINSDDFAVLERGSCPRRVNGTLMTSNVPGQPVTITEMDLSDPAMKGGAAFAQAIRDYLVRYPAQVSR